MIESIPVADKSLMLSGVLVGFLTSGKGDQDSKQNIQINLGTELIGIH